MNEDVLISIQPKWVALIRTFLGYDNRRPLYKKRLELRKSAPKPPFKAFIYETKGKRIRIAPVFYSYEGSGKIIGEFICDYIVRHCEMENADIAEEMSCVPRKDILKYSNGKEVFGWHISDLVIYKKPKDLSEFCIWKKCNSCRDTGYESTACMYDENCKVPSVISRPPQSWCYVEELKGDTTCKT